MQDTIREVLQGNLGREEAVFVFPTQTAAERWAEYAVLNTEFGAVPMERFLAWDDFKGGSIRSMDENREFTAVPALMRSVFAARFIQDNARTLALESLIAPEYAAGASGFCEWIARILPSLGVWRERFEQWKSRGGKPDSEDRDLERLFASYSDFLSAHKLFDPAWQKPPFRPDGRKYLVFFPEILSDYGEYREILESSDDIQMIHVPEQEERPRVACYKSSREELRQAALKIRALHEKEGLAWQQIALSVPEIETYAPYIEQEFSRHEIPFSLRIGGALGKSGAGCFFSQAQDCDEENFSFDSLRRLLMNFRLPWSKSGGAEQARSRLLDFGRENNCICSYHEDGKFIDIWERSFASPKKKEGDEAIRGLYRSLKERVRAMTRAKSFKEIRTAYFEFKREFFDSALFSVQSDRIISRCVAELSELADLEEKFPDCRISSPYSFFVRRLLAVNYVEQGDSRGVFVFPYKVAASAPFEAHVVINAGQDALSVEGEFKRLSFLSERKRQSLNVDDHDPTRQFVMLYAAMAGRAGASFSVSDRNFTGYSFPHGFLEPASCQKSESDPISEERKFLRQEGSEFPKKIFGFQAGSFSAWSGQRRKARESAGIEISNEELQSLVLKKTMGLPWIEKKFGAEFGGKFHVSASSLKDFFRCPRMWLFKRVLGIESVPDAAELADDFLMGTVRHDAFSKYFQKLKEAGRRIHAEADRLPPEEAQFLRESVSEAVRGQRLSALGAELLLQKEQGLFDELCGSIVEFSHWFDGCQVLMTEERGEGEVRAANELCRMADGADFFAYGKVDCLLRGTQGLVLVDFKSSSYSVPKILRPDQIERNSDSADFQMPLYVYLLEGQESPAFVSAGVFYDIKGRQPKVSFGRITNPYKKGSYALREAQDSEGNFVGRKEFEDSIRYFLDKAEDFVRCVRGMSFQTSSEMQNYTTCTSSDCADFRPVCRKFFTVSPRGDDF